MIGRTDEIQRLEAAFESPESEFVAVYGRRRVGKTYLVRETFNDRFVFRHSGLAKAGRARQLSRFRQSLVEFGSACPHAFQNWDQAFDALKPLIVQSPLSRKVVFIDEMPWMDTPRSGFLTALEGFWNGWASARKDVLLIVCGSAASWMVKNLFRNKGGLHNRVTVRIHLQPFTLRECEELALSMGIRMTREDIAEGYMALGGIPYYWKNLDRRFSLAQNMDRLFFADGAPLRYEFDELYSSLFGRSALYKDIVRALATRRKAGMTRQELCEELALKSSGKFSQAVQVLEQCGFVRSYNMPGRKKKGSIIQLMDAFTLFHFRFLDKGGQPDEHTWTLTLKSSEMNAWRGLAFERLALWHLPQIRAALGIAGVHMETFAWSHKADECCPKGAQIDLVLNRSDNVVNLCELKYANAPYAIKKGYAEELRNKEAAFEATEKLGKACHLTFITTKGLLHNEYWGMVQSEVTLQDLFK